MASVAEAMAFSNKFFFLTFCSGSLFPVSVWLVRNHVHAHLQCSDAPFPAWGLSPFCNRYSIHRQYQTRSRTLMPFACAFFLIFFFAFLRNGNFCVSYFAVVLKKTLPLCHIIQNIFLFFVVFSGPPVG